MTNDQSLTRSLLEMVLPPEMFDYFEIIDIQSDNESINVYLDELDIKPAGLENKQLTSKGFHKTALVQDFPIRERSVFLHVRRRRWLVESTGEIVSRNWDVVAKGTRYTKGFATFLKEFFRSISNQQ